MDNPQPARLLHLHWLVGADFAPAGAGAVALVAGVAARAPVAAAVAAVVIVAIRAADVAAAVVAVEDSGNLRTD